MTDQTLTALEEKLHRLEQAKRNIETAIDSTWIQIHEHFDDLFGKENGARWVNRETGMVLARVPVQLPDKINEAKLKELLPVQLWNRIIRKEEVVDQDKLEKEIKAGRIDPRVIAPAIEPGKRTFRRCHAQATKADMMSHEKS